MWTRFGGARDERDRGFTLIELLVVVIIVGVLAAIAIPVFLNQRRKGVDASLKSDLRTVAGLVETWMVDNTQSVIPGQVYFTGTPAVAGAGTVPFQITFTPSPGNFIVLSPLLAFVGVIVSMARIGVRRLRLAVPRVVMRLGSTLLTTRSVGAWLVVLRPEIFGVGRFVSDGHGFGVRVVFSRGSCGLVGGVVGWCGGAVVGRVVTGLVCGWGLR